MIIYSNKGRTMGDYDYGREHGMWGDDGVPYWIKYDNGFNEENNSNVYEQKNNLESIEVSLTPSKFLMPEEKYSRAKLINNTLDDNDINLEVMHNKYNKYDSLALEVYNKGIMIGHIQKYDAQKNINEFCFINNKKIKSLILSWKNDKFYLSRSLSDSEKNKQHELDMEIEKEKIKIEKLKAEKEKTKIERTEALKKHNDDLTNELNDAIKKFANRKKGPIDKALDRALDKETKDALLVKKILETKVEPMSAGELIIYYLPNFANIFMLMFLIYMIIFFVFENI